MIVIIEVLLLLIEKFLIKTAKINSMDLHSFPKYNKIIKIIYCLCSLFVGYTFEFFLKIFSKANNLIPII